MPRRTARSRARSARGSSLFDCINCDKCLPVCPNDANFVYETHAGQGAYRNYRVEGGRPVEAPGGRFAVRKAHQIANFQDFCNDCGNCDVFCPEDGGPYVEKPRFFGSLEAWRRERGRNGFFARREGDVDLLWGRIGGAEYRLEVDRDRDRAFFTDGDFTLELLHRERRPVRVDLRQGVAEGRTLDVAAYLAMAILIDGVLHPSRANPVNSAT